MEFGDKLVEARKGKGFSQEQLADQLGVSRQAISRWEAGAVFPDIANLKKIIELFDVSADYLLNDDCTQDKDVNDLKNIHKSQKRRMYRISLILLLLGVIGMGILILLSSQIPAIEMIPFISYDEADIPSGQEEAGQDILYVPKKVYSLIPFLDYYHLNLIAAGFLIMILGGIVLLIYENTKKALVMRINL